MTPTEPRRSKHVLISCVGSAGDVHPFIAMGSVLAKRGHRVELQANDYFRDRVLRAGLGFLPLGSVADYQATAANPDLWSPKRGFDVVAEQVLKFLAEGYGALADRVGPDTVLVGSTLAWQARLVQEKLGTPLVTVHLSPSCIFSPQAPTVVPQMVWFSKAPLWFRRGMFSLIERGIIDKTVGPGLNAFRASLNLPPVKRVFGRWMHSPQRVVCAFPDWFAPPQTDWPANSICTRFPHWAAPQGTLLDPMLSHFLQSGPPPIGFTPGSAMAHGKTFFERALAACDLIGRRAVFITPFADQLPPKLPAFARHAAYVPFDLLMPKLAAIVHHGGIGTTAQAMALGVPQLITPFAHDQFDNGARIAQLGVGASLSPDAPPTAWAQALLGILKGGEINLACDRYAALLGQDPAGAVQIADLIEQAAAKP